MSPVQIEEVRKATHLRFMVALATHHGVQNKNSAGRIAKEAWELLEAQEAFLAERQRIINGVPLDEEGV